MLVNDLAQVLRNQGCSVTEVGGWTTHNHGQLSAVQTVVIHHTAGAATGDYPSLNTVRNGRGGDKPLPGPLANLGVGRSGQVYVISSGLTYHAGTVFETRNDNAHSIGIEVESVGDGTPWPVAQQIAVAKVCAALCKKFGLPVSRVLGHKEICSPVGRKVDPKGIPGDMAAMRQLVQNTINGVVGSDDVAVSDVENMMWKGGPVAGGVAEDTLIARVNDLEKMVWAGGPVQGAVSEGTLIANVRDLKDELAEVKEMLTQLLNSQSAKA